MLDVLNVTAHVDSDDQCIGYETCEERGFTGGDSDDVWFYYHRLCYGQFIESSPKWVVELYRSISREQALEEGYICDLCGEPLARHTIEEENDVPSKLLFTNRRMWTNTTEAEYP
jgi:hypothetical protein